MKAYQNQVQRVAKPVRFSGHPQFNPNAVNKAIKSLYTLQRKTYSFVPDYECDSCGRQLSAKKFSFVDIACGNYTCRECVSERQFTWVNDEGGAL